VKECYQLISGGYKKFWTVEVVGCHYLVTFGRIGTDGQTQVKTFNRENEAQFAARKMANEKCRKGYVRCGDNSHPGAKVALLQSLMSPQSSAQPEAAVASPVTEPVYRRIVRDV
jgi:predicted DNA-binding WGR domain protein